VVSRGAHREVAAVEAVKRSQKENRVYVGNLSFQVRWSDLKDFMREGKIKLPALLRLNGASRSRQRCVC
jgi:RNA recognition motif-containing protein